MKKIILITLSILILSSCTSSPTEQECNEKYCADGTDCGFSIEWSQCMERIEK